MYDGKKLVCDIKRVKGNPQAKWRIKIRKLSPQRIAAIEQCCDALEIRLGCITYSKLDSPLEHPLCEVGYTLDSIGRLTDHACHDNSNYIMNLAEPRYSSLG